MKSTAQHEHPDGTLCWWDFGFEAWWTQDPETGINESCPGGKVIYELGNRDEPLVAGDAPHAVSD